MKISVIIPVYNGGPWIDQTLASLAAQNVPAAEIIAVDDGSTDGGDELIKDFPGIRLLRSPGKGVNAARRHGLDQARHPWVLLLDQDDVLHPGHLEQLSSALLENPTAPGAVSGKISFRHDTAPAFPTGEFAIERMDPWEIFPVNPIAISAQVLFRKQLLEDQGGWETRYPGAGGFHAWLTLTARRPFIQVPGPTVGQRLHATSLGHKLRPRNRWAYCDRYLTVAQNRVALRLRYHPSDGTRVRSRLRLARHLLAWRFADSMLSPWQTAPMALRLDQLLAEEAPEWQQTLLDEAFLLFPVDERSTRLRKAVGWVRLYQRCPRDARHLRMALRQHLKRRFSGMTPPLDPT